jgi:hypothetical protein
MIAKREKGDIFGLLTLVKPARRPHYWVCRCKCGSFYEYLIYNLTNGYTYGCKDCRPERIAARKEERWGRFPYHAPTIRYRTEYGVWHHLSSRKVVSLTFPKFLQKFGKAPDKRHSLHRIDEKKSWTGKNTRWLSGSGKMHNYNGEIMNVDGWANKLGISRTAMFVRLKNWPKEEAFTRKPHRGGKNSKGRPVGTIKKMYTHKGRTMGVADWAKVLGISDSSIRYRIKNWSRKDVFRKAA